MLIYRQIPSEARAAAAAAAAANMRPPSIPQTIPIHEHDTRQIKIMKSLYNTLVEYREPKTNRIVVQLFISLPSRKDFPEYFDIIERPISMYEIRKRIESNYYRAEESCIDDFKLMFNNCKVFNEDLSQIFKDAVKLEELLLKRYDQLLVENGRPAGGGGDSAIKHHSTPSTRRAERLNNSNHASAAKLAIKNEESITSSPITNSRANHNNTTSNSHHSAPTTGFNLNQSTSNKSSNNNNGISTYRDNDSNSNNFSSCNGNVDNLIINHNYHNETSIDSSSNISLAATSSTSDKPKRLKKDPDAPKRRLLTGYIIYAAEVRKEYVDKHPNQDFGFISRLIGNDWKALPRDLRIKYDQRALAHNKKIRERALKESMLGTPDVQPVNNTSTPKLSKRKLAKQAELMRQNHLSAPSIHDNSSIQSPARHLEHTSNEGTQATNNSSFKHSNHRQHLFSPHRLPHSGRTVTVDSSTQTAPIRFVEPPQKKRLAYSENFRRYIESLEVPNKDLLAEETTPERPPEPASSWLGAGIGRHESAEAALWALRDFMLQDAATMRWSMQPYLCY